MAKSVKWRVGAAHTGDFCPRCATPTGLLVSGRGKAVRFRLICPLCGWTAMQDATVWIQTLARSKKR